MADTHKLFLRRILPDTASWLAALAGSVCVRCDRRSRRGCRLAELGDLTEQLASMTERHPNVLVVLIRKIG